MGYVFLAIALLCGSVKGYCGKKTSGYVNEYKDAMLANSIRMILCTVIGFCMVAVGGGVSQLRIDGTAVWISLLAAVANSAFVVLWLIAVKKGAYMMLDVFSMLGVLIPLVGCACLFDEAIRLHHIVGFVILLTAVCIMCSYNNSIKTKMTLLSLVLLIGCGVSSGLQSFSQKLFVKLSSGTSVAVFNFYTYLFSTVLLGICFFAFSAHSNKTETVRVKPIFGYISVMAVCLFLNSYFATLAAERLLSAQLYPLQQGCALLLSTAMSAIFFKEKLTVKAAIGIVLAFIALIVMNVLNF